MGELVSPGCARVPGRVCVLGVSLIMGVLGGPAVASHEGSLFDRKSDISPAVYEENEKALEYFWGVVDDVLGSRLGHASEDDHDITSVDIEVGAVALSARDRRRLQAAAPSFVHLEIFRTRYSMADLKEFGRRSEKALGRAGLHELWGGFGYLDVPDRVTIHLVRPYPWADEILRSELPHQAFTIDIQGPAEVWPLPDSTGSRNEWQVVALTLIVSSVLGAVAVVWLKRNRGTSTRPKPAQ